MMITSEQKEGSLGKKGNQKLVLPLLETQTDE